ncbi:MAG: penicillin acylase family protein [Caldilineaceae bacterium]|nr:penicillin acylase family protein [Caldilineaceae bacterium]
MPLSTTTILQRLGAGEAIATICADAGMTPSDFRAWWQTECATRVPTATGTSAAPVTLPVEIVRDALGIPHIFAQNDADLFLGLGVAMAQDRLWQLDYLRRKATGRLAEILGETALSQDLLARTVGLSPIAAATVTQLPASTLALLAAFAQGINLVIDSSRDHWPIEFDLLGYTPEAWQPVDTVAIWVEFRWYLTGRLPVIALPELARRTLGNEALFQAFLTPEAGDESIVPPGSYPASPSGIEAVGSVVGDPEAGVGSNNWVVDGDHSHAGAPLLASDPHVPFGALSWWYEAHLSGGSFQVTGATYIGVPTVLFGRNEQVAWGLTNNICSQRDLYQEQTDPAHPGTFRYADQWEPARERTETIAIRDRAPVQKTIRFSRNGPVINELLPPPAQGPELVTLRWLGATQGDEITAMLNASRATDATTFRAALHDWHSPTFSFIFADTAGAIGYQCVGRIPIRHQWERGYRPGWDPAHQWDGVIPYAGMPALANPPQGWIRTANNRTAPADYPYPLSGTWSSGHRAERIRHLLEAQKRFDQNDFIAMHYDVRLQRATEAIPPLLAVLAPVTDPAIQAAAAVLAAWDYQMLPDQVGAALFEVFFRQWSRTVAAARFPAAMAGLMADVVGGLALTLLHSDTVGWFAPGQREAQIVAALHATLAELRERLGGELPQWTWGRLHTITLHHPLSGRGELATLLDRGGQPLSGNGFTVCNTGADANYKATLGASYRLIADLSSSPPLLWGMDTAGQSGHPGSPHYCGQLDAWLNQAYHPLPLARAEVDEAQRLVLQPTA